MDNFLISAVSKTREDFRVVFVGFLIQRLVDDVIGELAGDFVEAVHLGREPHDL